MRKYIFSILFFCLPIFCFSQTKEEVKIIDQALLEFGKTMSVKFLEVRGKDADSVFTKEHLGSLIKLNNRIQSYYSTKNELKSNIDNIRWCIDPGTRKIHFKKHYGVEKYIDFVYDNYIHKEFKRGGIYNVNQKLLAIKKKAKAKYNKLDSEDKSPAQTTEPPIEELAEEIDLNDPLEEDSLIQKTVTETDSLITENSMDTIIESVGEADVVGETTPPEQDEEPVEEKEEPVPLGKTFYFLSGIALSLLGVVLFKNRNKLKMKKAEKSLVELNEESKTGIEKTKGNKNSKRKKGKKGKASKKEKTTDANTETKSEVENQPAEELVATSVAASEIPIEEKSNEESLITPVSKFLTVGASVIGRSHIDNEIPCQDNHFFKELNYGWTLAVTADGAGSAKRSEIGSKLVSHLSVEKVFVEALEKTDWFKNGGFPEKDEEWFEIAKDGLKKIYDALCKYSLNRNDTALRDLACTVIIAIVRPEGILVSHIGDGRAGYKNDKEEWKSMITPYRGEEANSTVFITSNIWENEIIDNYLKSGVIRDKITAFTLLSDGCESHAFKCSQVDPETKFWSDPNLPFEGFYGPVIKTLLNLKNENISDDAMQERWKKFLTDGNEGLKNESDDKTMILGIYQDQETV